MTPATLTPAEVAFALSVATQRHSSKPAHIRDSRMARASAFAVHFAGVVGEVLFRKVHGGTINQTVNPMGDGHAADAILPDGRKVEVKTSTWSGPDVELKFSPDEIDVVEHCALVQVNLPDSGKVSAVYDMGAIRQSLVRKDYGHGPRFVFRPAAHNGTR